MTINNLLKIIEKYKPTADFELIRRAYDFAEEAHRGQKRLTGDDYILHPLHTAKNLADLRLDETMIVAGLLHDVAEDTAKTAQEIEDNFGKEVATLVAGVTKLGYIKYRGIERYTENLRKMFVAMADDVRVIVIKFADRLHNLETLYAQPKDKQLRIAEEVMQIYAPIANRLGMWELKGRLEDEAFKYLLPSEYEHIKTLIEPIHEKSAIILAEIKSKIRHVAKANNIELELIQGRAKNFYKIYLKVKKHNNSIDQIYDLIANRIIVKSVGDCYAMLGIIHNLWKPLKGRIKDYIAQPKPNGYQSLHTTVFGPGGGPIEFQIRTHEMHQDAEYGIASHWHYDETVHTGKIQRKPSKDIEWIKELSKWKKEHGSENMFLENLKIDFFRSRIFVFTPKGDIIDMVEHSTPIDFAYHIHSDIGNSCIGARVNNHQARLDSPLKSGDLVEIIVNKSKKKPDRNWLKFVKTSLAKSRIKYETRIKIPFITKG
jgi:GTP pyrophosphokinase